MAAHHKASWPYKLNAEKQLGLENQSRARTRQNAKWQTDPIAGAWPYHLNAEKPLV